MCEAECLLASFSRIVCSIEEQLCFGSGFGRVVVVGTCEEADTLEIVMEHFRLEGWEKVEMASYKTHSLGFVATLSFSFFQFQEGRCG